jgi:integrase/recombinase XerD
MTTSTTLLPFQPDAMTPAQLAAVSYLARYSGHTHALYAYQLRRWFGWCEANGLDALIGVQRAHVELYIRHLRDCGLRDSSICTMLHGVRGFCEPGTPLLGHAPPRRPVGYANRNRAPPTSGWAAE